MTFRPSIRDVVEQMIALVPDDAIHDLQYEDPASAVEVHYDPVCVHRLPPASIIEGDCSVDGYYESFIDPASPRILYSDEVVAERARFTIIHELGHHIVTTTGAALLDYLDQIGGSPTGAHKAEELACHQFAGQVLVPTKLLDDIIASDSLTPRHVVWAARDDQRQLGGPRRKGRQLRPREDSSRLDQKPRRGSVRRCEWVGILVSG